MQGEERCFQFPPTFSVGISPYRIAFSLLCQQERAGFRVSPVRMVGAAAHSSAAQPCRAQPVPHCARGLCQRDRGHGNAHQLGHNWAGLEFFSQRQAVGCEIEPVTGT